MSDKETNTENAAKVASNGEEHRNATLNVTGEKQGYDTWDYEEPVSEEEAKRILKSVAPTLWTKHLLRPI